MNFENKASELLEQVESVAGQAKDTFPGGE